MKYYINIVYSKTPPEKFLHDSSGTNQLELASDRNVDHHSSDEKFILRFKLTDSHVSQKFVEVWNSTTDEMKIHYNTYTALTADEILEKQKIMNNTIRQINDIEYKSWRIPEDLILELNGNDRQIDKLNALHRFFEDCSYDCVKERTSTIHSDLLEKINKLFPLLEQVNYLVHRTEGGPSPQASDYLVFRNMWGNPLADTIQLSDIEYNMFVPTLNVNSNCCLFLDYSTVGKDLEACWKTNDLELVNAKELKQQQFINPAFNFTFNEYKTVDPGDITDKFLKEGSHVVKNEWCKQNNVDEHYEYWLPKYNIGRIKIGQCVSKEITGVVSYREMLKEYPYIVDIIVGQRYE